MVHILFYAIERKIAQTNIEWTDLKSTDNMYTKERLYFKILWRIIYYNAIYQRAVATVNRKLHEFIAFCSKILG